MNPYESTQSSNATVSQAEQHRRFGWRPAAGAFLAHLFLVVAVWSFIAFLAGPQQTMWASLLMTAVDLPVSLGTFLLLGYIGPDSPFALIMGSYHAIFGGIQWGLVAGWLFRRRSPPAFE